MTRLERSRIPTPVWGLLGLLVAVVILAAIFIGPGSVSKSPFVLHAVFRSQTQVGINNPVRIAGVRVGQVTDVQPVGDGSDAANVTMELDPQALPVHTDATLKIRSRLLLEGNYYLELRPGASSAPKFKTGGTIPASNTSGPVQLDQVLADLTSDTRMDLRTTVQGLGEGIGGSQNGEPASKALHRSLTNWPAALLGITRATRALQGEQPDDLSGLVEGTSETFGALASRQRQLSELIVNLNTTMAATAASSQPLAQSIALLPSVLTASRSTSQALNTALPPTTEFAREIQPGLKELPATITAALPWIDQATPLLSNAELGGLTKTLAPTVRDTAAVVNALTPAVRQLDQLDQCFLHNVIPTGDVKIQDSFSTGATAAQEFFQTFVGLASAGQNFDGNGRYFRAQTGGGSFPVVTSPLPDQGEARGNAALQPLGTRPAYPGKAPQVRTDVPCVSNTPPDLNGAKTGGTP